MSRTVFVALAVVVGLHGLIHLMGLVAYWPLGTLSELPYKTAVLGGRWELGAGGMRLYSVLWLIAAVGFVIVAAALIAGWSRWLPALFVVTLLSLIVTALDWGPAFRGAIVNILILAVLLIGPRVSNLLPQIGS
jgi:hypothetical protein